MQIKWLALLLMPSLAHAQYMLTLNDASVVQANPNKMGTNIGAINYYDNGQVLKNIIGTQSQTYEPPVNRVVRVVNSTGSTTSFTDQSVYIKFPYNYWAGGSFYVTYGPGAENGCSGTITGNTGDNTPASASNVSTAATFVLNSSTEASAYNNGDSVVVGSIDPTVSSTWFGYPVGTVASVAGANVVVTYTSAPSGSLPANSYITDLTTPMVWTTSACSHAYQAGDVVSLTTALTSTPENIFETSNGGFWASVTGGAQLLANTTDLCATCGTQTLNLNATSGTAKATQYFDSAYTADIFVLLDGTYQVSFWAKSNTGSPSMSVTASRVGTRAFSCGPYTPTLTSTWTQFTYNCTTNEVGISSGNSSCVAGGTQTLCTIPTGPASVAWTVTGGSAYLDNTSFASTSDTNPTVFRASYINAVKNLNPGFWRYWVNQNGETAANWTAPDYARQPTGVAAAWTGPAGGGGNQLSLEDYLVAANYIGTTPYLEIPVTFTPTEAANLIEFLAAPYNKTTSGGCVSGCSTYGQRRVSLGQNQPWIGSGGVFPTFWMTWCNECWNNPAGQTIPNRTGESFVYQDYNNALAVINAAMRADAYFPGTPYVYLGMDIQTGTTSLPSITAKPDFLEVQGYDMTYVDCWTTSCEAGWSVDQLMWQPAYAETYSSFEGPNGSGEVGDYLHYYATVNGLQGSSICGASGTAACIVTNYETGPSMEGQDNGVAFPQAQADYMDAGAGVALQEMRALMGRLKAFGLPVQNMFSTTEYNNNGIPSGTVKLWGEVVDSGGATGNFRPTWYALQMMNTAIIGSEYTANFSGTGLTYSFPWVATAGASPNSGVGTGAVSALPYVDAYCFKSGTSRSCELLNYDLLNSHTVTFSGTNVPTGTVNELIYDAYSQCASPPAGYTAIDCMNEAGSGSNTYLTPSTVTTTTGSLSSPTSVTLHPYEAVVYSWTASGSTYTITVSSITGHGTVTSSDSVINCTTGTTGTCTDSTATGTITLTAAPSSGYTFSGWGGSCSGTGTCSVSTTATVTASFSIAGSTPVTTLLLSAN